MFYLQVDLKLRARHSEDHHDIMDTLVIIIIVKASRLKLNIRKQSKFRKDKTASQNLFQLKTWPGQVMIIVYKPVILNLSQNLRTCAPPPTCPCSRRTRPSAAAAAAGEALPTCSPPACPPGLGTTLTAGSGCSCCSTWSSPAGISGSLFSDSEATASRSSDSPRSNKSCSKFDKLFMNAVCTFLCNTDRRGINCVILICPSTKEILESSRALPCCWTLVPMTNDARAMIINWGMIIIYTNMKEQFRLSWTDVTGSVTWSRVSPVVTHVVMHTC